MCRWLAKNLHPGVLERPPDVGDRAGLHALRIAVLEAQDGTGGTFRVSREFAHAPAKELTGRSTLRG